MNPIERIKAEIDFKKYLETHEGHTFKGSKTVCPFHNDHEPSMDVNLVNGRWIFYCHACKSSGDIINYIEKKHGRQTTEIMKDLSEEFNLEPSSTKKTEYIYRDVDGNEIFKKVKIKNDNGEKKYVFYHMQNGQWLKGKGNHEVIPYNLDRFKDFDELIICEGEKDADNINKLNIDLLATTVPFGQSSWDDSLTKYFEDKKCLYFLYDVGAEKYVQSHASKIKSALPDITICIAEVPLKNREDDVSDYLNKFDDLETKKEKLEEIICAAEPFELGETLEERGYENIFVGTLEEFMFKSIPEIENLVEPYVVRGGLTEIGGVKGSHKSFFVTNMALFFSSGISPFLTAIIEKPGRALLIQQEISMGFMKKRLERIRMGKVYDTGERFYPITTTARQLKLLNEKDYDKIKEWIELYEPDILILDPLSSFNTSEENMSKDMAKIISRLSEIKAEYNLGLVITHHFSNKKNPDDPMAPVEAGAWFRGHTVLSDAADVLICLHRLPGQRENPNLPLPYEDYNLVEVALRNDRQPEKFAIEFDEDTFLLKESDIWQEIGKRIMPGEIEELLQANEGQMMQKDVIEYFKSMARPTTVKRGISEAMKQNRITKEILKERGTPVLLKLARF